MHRLFSRPNLSPPTFKFTDSNGDVHKLQLTDSPSLSTLQGLIAPYVDTPFKLKYTDPEGDRVLLLSDKHFSVCLRDALVSPSSLHLEVVPSSASLSSSSIVSTASTPLTPETNDSSSFGSLSLSHSPQIHNRSHKSNLRLYNRALSLEKANLRALRGRASLHLAAKEWEKARTDFQAILDIADTISNSMSTENEQGEPQLHLDSQEMMHVRRGLILALIGSHKYKESLAVASPGNTAVGGNEWFVGVLKERLNQLASEALELLEGSKFVEAIEMYGQALALEDVYVEVGEGRRKRSLRVGRAMANEALERISLALEDYREVVAMNGGMTGWKGCGRCLMEIGELGPAYEMYHRALTEDPTCREAIEQMRVIQELQHELGIGGSGKQGRAIE